MEYVVDSNYLTAPELDDFFKKSPNNKVVITSDLQNEASQTVDIETIRGLTKTLTKYPKQVISLKSTATICGLSGRSKGLKRRLIHKDSSEGFVAFSNFMDAEHQNDSEMTNILLQDAHIKKEIVGSIKSDASSYLRAFANTERLFSESEVLTIRKNQPLKKETIQKFYNLVIALASQRFKEIPNRGKWPANKEWPNLFLFRLSLFHTLYFLNWIVKGSPKHLNLEKIGNDLIDLNFCTYATYFDGLLTKDKRCKKVFEEGNVLLETMIIQSLEFK